MLKRFWNDIKKYMPYIGTAASADLKAEVASSRLNWVWWVVEPVCLMLIYAFIFGTVLGARSEYFTAFIFIGITVWNFFNRVFAMSVRIVRFNKPIVTKVYLPKYVLVIQQMAENAFKMGINMLIVAGLMVFFHFTEGLEFSWYILDIIPTFVVLALFTFGMSTIVLHFGVFIDDLANVVSIVMRLGFYLSGIMYSISDRLPGVLGDILLYGNPMAFLIESTRRALLYAEPMHWVWMGLWGLVSIVLCVIGVRLIYKNENGYIKAV